jgi:hypothetical protein
MGYSHLYRWKVDVVLTDQQSGEVEVLDTFWEFESLRSAVAAGARHAQYLIMTDPTISRDQLTIDASTNMHEIDEHGPDHDTDYKVITSYGYFDAMERLEEVTRQFGPPVKMIETVSCPIEKLDGWDVVSDGWEYGVVLHVLGADGGFLKHIRVTARSLQAFEEFAASMWQAVEWLGRIDEKRKIEDPF